MNVLARAAAAAVLLASAPSAVKAQTTISTESAALDSYAAGTGINGSTFGQTFQVPNSTDVFLESFRYSFTTSSSTWYRGFLMEWDVANGRPVGPVLYASPEGTSPAETRGVIPYVGFDVGGVQLSSDARYVFYVSIGYVSYFKSSFTYPVDAYTDGNRVRKSPFPFDDGWFTDTRSDAGFSATFAPSSTVTPEPVSMALLGTGLFGVGAAARRRRRREDGAGAEAGA